MSRSLKNFTELKNYKKNHYNRYKESNVIGPIRAWGSFKKINTALPKSPEKPAFRGVCQAFGTAECFQISVWDNGSDFRFEICEIDGYNKKNVSPIF